MNTIEHMLSIRQKKAFDYLPKSIRHEVRLLGEGGEGVVFGSMDKVYKVYDNLREEDFARIKRSVSQYRGAKHLYDIESFVPVSDAYLMIYPNEESSPAIDVKTEEWQDFLAEMWMLKLVSLDVKPKNFIRTSSGIKLIDNNLYPYTDNYFLNMCVRTFVYCKYQGVEEEYLRKLARSVINQFDLPELEGVQEFVNGVFLRVIYMSSSRGRHLLERQNVSAETQRVPLECVHNLEHIFYSELKEGRYLSSINMEGLELDARGYLSPQNMLLDYISVTPFRVPVSLVIKTCAQDCHTIYANVKHIIRQLVSPHSYCEHIIAIDTKTDNFLRQFTKDASWEKLMQEVSRLVDEGIVDRYIIMPIEEAVEVNERWFGVRSSCTHSSQGAPVTPQLYLFEQTKGDYVLQMDSDVLIGRDDMSHDYLEDMVGEMELHNNVVSVGFNIYQDKGVKFKPYFGYEDGGFAPEVRMGLFHKGRMFSMRPFYNREHQGGWEYTWFRTMHLRQRELGMASVRGGDRRTYYIHPQNYRKSVPDVWLTILDRVEQGEIPECQFGKFDCEGSYYDWCTPMRTEPYVFVTTVRNVEYGQILRLLASVLSQIDERWGMVLIDDASDNGLSLFLQYVTRPFRDKITLVRNRVRGGGLYNHYKAIHYFIANPDTVVITADGDDALIGDDVLSQLADRYEKHSADVVIGRIYQNYRLQAHYRYPANFVSPRLRGGNVWQHIRSFRKYLFDSVGLWELKKNPLNSSVSKAIQNSAWLESAADFAFMVPIVEMSQKPNQLDRFTYYYDRDVSAYTDQVRIQKEENIGHILNLPSKTPNDVVRGRRTFIPNMGKIEIDITYECNLGCEACNRSCPQAPTTEQMSLNDIERFVLDSISVEKKWEFINVLGGEPTLHPELEAMLACLIEDYVRVYSPQTQIQIVSNGYTEKSRQILEGLMRRFPELMIDYSSFKTSKKVEYFSPFNDAPVDDAGYIEQDYKKGCWVTSFCGIGLNKYGYYACSVCGGIDRVLGGQRCAVSCLKDLNLEELQGQLSKFCRFCGNFKDYDKNQGLFIPRVEKAPLAKNIVSPTWKKIYDTYNQSR